MKQTHCYICISTKICCDLEELSYCLEHCPVHQNRFRCAHELIVAVNYNDENVECKKCGKLWVPA